VLAGLNAAFPIDRTDGKFLTAWCGVYDAADRSLTFASAGHHEALLLPPAGPAARLGNPGPLIGFFPDAASTREQITVAPGSLLYLFSDGGFEVADAAGALLGYHAFATIVAAVARDPATAPPRAADGRLDAIVGRVMAHAAGPLADDFALPEVSFA